MKIKIWLRIVKFKNPEAGFEQRLEIYGIYIYISRVVVI